ncbi:MAG: site-specific integrase [Bacteroidota bacterium]
MDIENFKVGRVTDGVDPITVNIQLKHLRAAFRTSVRLKFVSENPCEGVSFLRHRLKEAVFMTEGEFGRLFMMIPDIEFRNLVSVTVLTAMRRGEVINLPWKHVDFEKQRILIHPFKEFDPKGHHIRSIPMNWWVMDYLKQKPRNGEYVFGRPDGLLLKGDTVNQKLKRYVRRAELDTRLHFHSLRHTGISLLIKKGVPPSYVQRIAGHSSLIVTQRYVHVEENELLNAVNLMSLPILN